MNVSMLKQPSKTEAKKQFIQTQNTHALIRGGGVRVRDRGRVVDARKFFTSWHSSVCVRGCKGRLYAVWYSIDVCVCVFDFELNAGLVGQSNQVIGNRTIKVKRRVCMSTRGVFPAFRCQFVSGQICESKMIQTCSWNHLHWCCSGF